MKPNQDKTDDSYNLDHKNQPFTYREKIENISYLYPTGHRMNHQMRWLKVSINEAFVPGFVA